MQFFFAFVGKKFLVFAIRNYKDAKWNCKVKYCKWEKTQLAWEKNAKNWTIKGTLHYRVGKQFSSGHFSQGLRINMWSQKRGCFTHHCQAQISCHARCQWEKGRSWRGSWDRSSAQTWGRASTCAADRELERDPPPAPCPHLNPRPGSSHACGHGQLVQSTTLPPPAPDAAAVAVVVGECGSLGSSSAQPYRSLNLQQEGDTYTLRSYSKVTNPQIQACVFICFSN